MKDTFRKSMAWLHTWSGLIVGWLLFAIFLTGTASVFRQEITLWMQPELPLAAAAAPEAATTAVDRLRTIAPDASEWLIELPDTRDPLIHVYAWRDPGEMPDFEEETLDPASGAPVMARATEGGDFLYYFRFDLQMPSDWGRLLVGAAAIIMLVALISGVITHRRIFKDFFSFRPGLPALRAWRDAHNAVGVLALPFHLMITYTGLVTLMFLYMPWGIDVAYEGDEDAFFAEVFGAPAREAANTPASLVPIEPLMDEASRRWNGVAVGRITVYRPGDANALIELESSDTAQLAYQRQKITFDGSTGEILAATDPTQWAAQTRGVLYGLHLGRFADPLLRWLYFLSGLAGSVMIATGLIHWGVKRRPQAAARPGFGYRLVETLNIGTVVGLPIAIAALFWANRLLPVALEGRAEWEIIAFFSAWALAALYPLLRPARRAWTESLWTAALLFALLPLLNALTTTTHLGASLPQGDWARAGFDLTMLVTGVLCGVTAWQVGRRWPRAAVSRRPARNARAPAAATHPIATPPGGG